MKIWTSFSQKWASEPLSCSRQPWAKWDSAMRTVCTAIIFFKWSFNSGFLPGIPAVQHERRRRFSGAVNILIISTVLSAVTAIALQISLSYSSSKSPPLLAAANGVWFVALVLSMGASFSSLLTMSEYWLWVHSCHWLLPPPNLPALLSSGLADTMPKILRSLNEMSPLLNLGLSIGCFSLGLILFVYASLEVRKTNFNLTSRKHQSYIADYSQGPLLLSSTFWRLPRSLGLSLHHYGNGTASSGVGLYLYLCSAGGSPRHMSLNGIVRWEGGSIGSGN